MAYVRRGNSPKLDGAPSRWAIKLATIALNSLLFNRDGNAMCCAIIHEIGCLRLTMPRTSHTSFEALTYYRTKLHSNRLTEVHLEHQRGCFGGLKSAWRRYSHGFVHFRIDAASVQPLSILDHNSSVRAALEIDDLERPAMPSLGLIDDAFGTTFELMHEKWLETGLAALQKQRKELANVYAI